MKNRMLLEVWSDVMCPFCYIGKRRLDKALAQFDHRDDVDVVWKSFQLAPALKTDTTVNAEEYLIREKGIDVRAARQMNDRVARMGVQEGIDLNFAHTKVGNTFNAHRLIQFAKRHGKGNEAAERLFRAYFTEGRNLASDVTLIQLCADLGLDADVWTAALHGEAYADETRADIEEARQLGIQAVPFFLFNRRYAISGAQEIPLFLRTLENAHSEWMEDAAAAHTHEHSGSPA